MITTSWGRRLSVVSRLRVSGPRDAVTGDSLGGTTYFGASAELHSRFRFCRAPISMRGALFADAGTVFNYDGRRTFSDGTTLTVQDSRKIRSSVGAGIIWQSPFGPIRFGLRDRHFEGGWRSDAGIPAFRVAPRF